MSRPVISQSLPSNPSFVNEWCNHVQSQCRHLCAQRHQGWTIKPWKRALWWDKSVFQIVVFGWNSRCGPCTKDETDRQGCCQVQKVGGLWCYGAVPPFESCEKQWQHCKVLKDLVSWLCWDVSQAWRSKKDVFHKLIEADEKKKKKNPHKKKPNIKYLGFILWVK